VVEPALQCRADELCYLYDEKSCVGMSTQGCLQSIPSDILIELTGLDVPVEKANEALNFSNGLSSILLAFALLALPACVLSSFGSIISQKSSLWKVFSPHISEHYRI